MWYHIKRIHFGWGLVINYERSLQIVRFSDTDLYAFLLPSFDLRDLSGWDMVQVAADRSSQNPNQTNALPRHYSQTTPPQMYTTLFFVSMKLHFATCRDFGYSNDVLLHSNNPHVQADHCSLVINFPLFPPSNNICHVVGMSSNLVSTIISPPVVSILPSLIHPLRSEIACPARSR